MSLGLGLGQNFQHFGNGLQHTSDIYYYVYLCEGIVTIINNYEFQVSFKYEKHWRCALSYNIK